MIKISEQEKINTGKADWQQIRIDKPYNELRKPPGFENWSSITAHPPAKFIIEAEEPVKICGYLNITGQPKPMQPVEVRIAEMIIGYLYLPGNRTHTVHLPKGIYEVSVTAADANYQHVYLLFTKSESESDA